VHLVM